jgi:hypothetical protein
MKNTIIAITITTAISIIPTAIPKIITTIIGAMTTPEIAARFHPRTITKITIHPEIPTVITLEIDGMKIDRIRAIIQIELVAIHHRIDPTPAIIPTRDTLATIDIPIAKMITTTPTPSVMTIPAAHQQITPLWIDSVKMMVTI